MDREIVIKIPEDKYDRLMQQMRLDRNFNECEITELGEHKEAQKRVFTNSEWIDFLSKQFDVSRTSAKDMLHAMMAVKREDNFKKQFSGAKPKDPEAPATEAAEMEGEER